MIKISAGILILFKNKALLAHSTNASWWRSYTPPKGGTEGSESFAETASREVKEEVGIFIDSSQLNEVEEVVYKTPTGKVYKKVYLFIHRIETLEEIGLSEEHIPFSQLQKEEIDEAKFMEKEEAIKKLLPRYIPHVIPHLEKIK